MLKLENWSDFFKFNKETLDDDYNAGQHLVVKTKQKSADGTSVRNLTFAAKWPINMNDNLLGIHNHIQTGSRW
jgi:hypothetical protein